MTKVFHKFSFIPDSKFTVKLPFYHDITKIIIDHECDHPIGYMWVYFIEHDPRADFSFDIINTGESFEHYGAFVDSIVTYDYEWHIFYSKDNPKSFEEVMNNESRKKPKNKIPA